MPKARRWNFCSFYPREAVSLLRTATWLAGWVAGCPSQPVLYQND